MSFNSEMRALAINILLLSALIISLILIVLVFNEFMVFVPAVIIAFVVVYTFYSVRKASKDGLMSCPFLVYAFNFPISILLLLLNLFVRLPEIINAILGFYLLLTVLVVRGWHQKSQTSWELLRKVKDGKRRVSYTGFLRNFLSPTKRKLKWNVGMFVIYILAINLLNSWLSCNCQNESYLCIDESYLSTSYAGCHCSCLPLETLIGQYAWVLVATLIILYLSASVLLIPV